jgi:peptide/nickel transport system substrate-binding protein
MTQIDTSFPVGMLAEAGPNAIGHILPKRDTLHNEAEEAAYDRNPIGAGPLKLTGHVPAEVMEFERFEDFYYQPKNGLPEDRRVKIQSWALRLVPEEATRVAAIRAGEADIAPASLATREQVEAGGGRLIFGPEGVYVRVRLDGCWADPNFPCHDKRVRQALDYAINKEVIRDQLYGGTEVFQAKGWALVTPGSMGYSPELDPWPYDPDKARQLLAEAGYPEGKGFGKLIVNTWVSTSMPYLPEGAQLAADSWRRELGIEVEVRVGDEASINAARRAGDLAGQITWRDNEARLDGASIVRSSYGTPDLEDRFHNDPELFNMVKATLAVTDEAERPQAFNRLYRRLRDETYELGIGYVNIPWAVGPRVQTWQPFAFSFFPSGMHTITLE